MDTLLEGTVDKRKSDFSATSEKPSGRGELPRPLRPRCARTRPENTSDTYSVPSEWGRTAPGLSSPPITSSSPSSVSRLNRPVPDWYPSPVKQEASSSKSANSSTQTGSVRTDGYVDRHEEAIGHRTLRPVVLDGHELASTIRVRAPPVRVTKYLVLDTGDAGRHRVDLLVGGRIGQLPNRWMNSVVPSLVSVATPLPLASETTGRPPRSNVMSNGLVRRTEFSGCIAVPRSSGVSGSVAGVQLAERRGPEVSRSEVPHKHRSIPTHAHQGRTRQITRIASARETRNESTGGALR